MAIQKKNTTNSMRLKGLCRYINDLNNELFWLTNIEGNSEETRIVNRKLRFIKYVLADYPLVQKYLKYFNRESAIEFDRNDYRKVYIQSERMIVRIMDFEEKFFD